MRQIMRTYSLIDIALGLEYLAYTSEPWIIVWSLMLLSLNLDFISVLSFYSKLGS